jgi:glutamate/tyrosine decarboxylase-like PLP-dependent enzyme
MTVPQTTPIASPSLDDLLDDASSRAKRYLAELEARPVAPLASAIEALAAFDHSLPDDPQAPESVLAMLDDLGSPATVANAGSRFFGFVIGGSLPAALAANWLAAAWDQNAGFNVLSPIGSTLETVAERWLVEVLGLPLGTSASFVTGCTMANFTALAAARHEVLARTGWDVGAQGLFGAPEVSIVVGEEAHPSLYKSLTLLGFGRDRVVRVPVDAQGRMRADALPQFPGPAIVCIQAGNVNTGAFDPAREICDWAHASGAWVHVDGAFGLWAAAAPGRAHLMAGYANADSWATDAHKWLNVPYDSGLAFVRNPAPLRQVMNTSAAYLPASEARDPYLYTPEMSRRARGIEVWAALLSLGSSGIADLVERTCRHATRFAEGLAGAGYAILNDVELNQVLVSFGEPDVTRNVIAAIQADGTSWCGGTVWQGQTAMRISVSSWATTESDVDRSLANMIQIAASIRPT